MIFLIVIRSDFFLMYLEILDIALVVSGSYFIFFPADSSLVKV